MVVSDIMTIIVVEEVGFLSDTIEVPSLEVEQSTETTLFRIPDTFSVRLIRISMVSIFRCTCKDTIIIDGTITPTLLGTGEADALGAVMPCLTSLGVTRKKTDTMTTGTSRTTLRTSALNTLAGSV